ncbi:glycosyl hydrolase [Eisenbergiella sp.]
MIQLSERFSNPSAIYRSAPLWVWNDHMEQKNIDWQLEELKRHGFGGAFVHPRPGLLTPYLSEEWFRLWKYALNSAKRLGMKLYIYDENSYPSAFAGGHVPKELPDCVAASAVISIHKTSEFDRVQEKEVCSFIKAFICERRESILFIIKDVSLFPSTRWSSFGEEVCLFHLIKGETTSWLAGYANVDPLRPEVTKEFLTCTYEKYFTEVGEEFGKDIPAIFSDEPYVSGGGAYCYSMDSIPFSYWFAQQFYKMKGYSILDNLPALFYDTKNLLTEISDEKVRFDYYETVRELWTNNFFKPISTWCREKKIVLTGHYMEHQWPLAFGGCMSPAVMANYEFEDWPGIDLLQSFMLREEPYHPLQLTMQEAKSVANQLGKERVVCETYGAGGWDIDVSDMKRIADWLLVNGVNFINQHLVYSTITGARKRDHPQSFDWREPWWDEYTELNNYMARLSFVLSQGRMEQRILVLHPTTTGYLVPVTQEDGCVEKKENILRKPEMIHYQYLLQYLTDNQYDYDLGDEYILEHYGKTEQGLLNCGNQCYEVIVLSGDMKNIRSYTYQLLYDFLEQGGKIVCVGSPGNYIDGMLCQERWQRLMDRKSCEMIEDLTLLPKLLPKPYFLCDIILPQGFNHIRRRIEDGNVFYFFVNHSMGTVTCQLRIKGNCIVRWNCVSGKKEYISFQKKAGVVSFDLVLERGETLLLQVLETVEKGEKNTKCHVETKLDMLYEAETELVRIQMDKPNRLILDYCTLYLDGKIYENLNAIHAGRLIFQNRGFQNNPWDGSVQFKDRIISRNDYGEESGFAVEYYFYCEGQPEVELWISVEYAEFYCLFVNDRAIGWSDRKDYLDHHMGMAEIGSFVRLGENCIRLSAPIFDVKLELDTIFLSGAFCVIQKDKKFILSRKRAFTLGDLVEQGLPFYSGNIWYDFCFILPRKTGKLKICIPFGKYSSCSIYIDGQREGLVQLDCIQKLTIDKAYAEGMHYISLKIGIGLKNLLGPHFDDSKPRKRAWPGMWKNAPIFGPVKADGYDLTEIGIYERPLVYYE